MLNYFEKEWLSKNGRNWTRIEVEERDDFVWWQVYGQIKDKEDELQGFDVRELDISIRPRR